MNDTDLDLTVRHRYGDEEAFEEIYRRFSQMVFNLALRMTGDPDEAADLSQETFLRIHRHLGGFKGRSSLKTWIYRVTVNCCRSRLRRTGRRKRMAVLADPETLARHPDSRRGPEEEALARDDEEVLAAALTHLPAVFREAVLLRDIEGLSYEEIAAVLGVRIGTVRSRIARGRDRLRLLLEGSR
jgi:RNA polymerase sigma-70 factor (ECF subfamily)